MSLFLHGFGRKNVKTSYLIGKLSVGKKYWSVRIIRRQKISSVKNIRHQGKNSSLFTDGFFTDKVFKILFEDYFRPKKVK